jgi:RNase adapter protein RapZ
MVEIAVITGLSGAGRSAAAAVLEDLGFYVVDNLPTSLLPTIVDLASQPGGIERLALVSGRRHDELLPHVARMRADGHRVTIVYLDASTPVLVQRYDATRRKHPLSDEAGGLLEAIELERTMLNPLKEHADLVIDSSELNVHQLKERLVSVFEQQGSTQLQIAVESFGYKNGLPLDADIVMDVRFLPNPHWDEALRPLTGHDPKVRDYVLERAVTSSFLDQFERMLLDVLPHYQAEGRSYLTIAIGCTGGRHRSVAIAEEIARRFAAHGIAARTMHRDVGTGI